MKNTLTNKYKHLLLGKIKGFAIQSEFLKKEFFKTSKIENRSQLANLRKDLKIETRHHLLAYAFLKGIPYCNIEEECAENNKPWRDKLHNIICQHVYEFDVKKYPIENIDLWLVGEIVPDYKPKSLKEIMTKWEDDKKNQSLWAYLETKIRKLGNKKYV